MVQRLPEGREETQRVEKQAVEDVCLIARNAIDRIGELERRLRKTKDHLNVHQGLAAALMNRPWVGLTDADRQAAFESLPDMFEGFLHKWGWLHFSKAIEAKLKEKNT